MPARDEQEFESKRQQIIEGALQVFASKGFENATNKEIAEAANIGSPGLIYHYFKDKHDLFVQVLEQRAPPLQLLTQTGNLMDLPPREVLSLFASSFLSLSQNHTFVALFRLMLGEAMRRPIVAEMIGKVGPGRGFAFFTRYLQKQMDAGVLKRMDAGAAARCFIGPLIAYNLTHAVFKLPDSDALTPETMAATVVEVFLKGMQVPDSDASNDEQ
jgi:AcrR family transcriptional regulator